MRLWRRMLAVLRHPSLSRLRHVGCMHLGGWLQPAGWREGGGQELPCLPGLQWKSLVCVWAVEQELSQQVATMAPEVVALAEQQPSSARTFLQRGKGCYWAQGLEWSELLSLLLLFHLWKWPYSVGIMLLASGRQARKYSFFHLASGTGEQLLSTEGKAF